MRGHGVRVWWLREGVTVKLYSRSLFVNTIVLSNFLFFVEINISTRVYTGNIRTWEEHGPAKLGLVVIIIRNYEEFFAK